MSQRLSASFGSPSPLNTLPLRLESAGSAIDQITMEIESMAGNVLILGINLPEHRVGRSAALCYFSVVSLPRTDLR